ncbi:class D sortase [Sporosarcina sp. ITBMC105]
MYIRRVIGSLLLVVGLGILFYPQIEKKAYHKEQQDLLDAFERLGTIEESEQPVVDGEVKDEVGSTADSEEADLLEGVTGLLQIEKIDLKIAIFDSSSVEALTKGVGMIEPEKQFGMNNIGIAGHRSVTHGKQFNRLREVEPGDTATVVTTDGTFEYVITDSFVVHQSEVSVLDDQEDPLLTLVTCTPLGSHNPPYRLIVQGKLVNGQGEK